MNVVLIICDKVYINILNERLEIVSKCRHEKKLFIRDWYYD